MTLRTRSVRPLALCTLVVGALALPARAAPVLSQPVLSPSQIAREDVALSPADTSTLGEFGIAADVDGERALIGAHLDDAATADAGSAVVFERASDGSWSEAAVLIAGDADPNDNFGRAVALSGERALVGAWRDDEKAVDAGAAYLFERQTNGSWTQVAKFMPSSGIGAAQFGKAVDLDGDHAVVGAAFDSVGGAASGAAYVFERMPSGTWAEVAKLEASDEGFGDRFGSAVAIDAGRILIGAENASPVGAFGGGAGYVFERQSSGAWVESAKIVASDATSQDAFGYAVDIEGDRALVAARQDDEVLANSGSVYVLELKNTGPGTEQWLETAKLLSSAPASGVEFGFAVRLDGARAAVAAPLDGDGAVDLYERRPDGTWFDVARAVATGASSGGTFGTSLGLDGGRLVTGGPGIDTAGVSVGAAFVFETASLLHGAPAISLASGGSQRLHLRAGPEHAGEFFLMLGSASGIAPGAVDPVTGIAVPLNVDAYLLALALGSGAGLISPFVGVLDADGSGESSFVLPPGQNPALAGTVIHHGFLTVDLFGSGVASSASNPARLALVP